MAIAILEESEIQKIISEAVKLASTELLEELERSRTPELMTKDRLAEYLTCSIASINRFMAKGMPVEKCGDQPRFRKCCIDAWMKNRRCTNKRSQEAVEQKLDRVIEALPALYALGELLIEADFVTKAKHLNRKTISQNDKLEKFQELAHRKVLMKLSSIPVIRQRKRRKLKRA